LAAVLSLAPQAGWAATAPQTLQPASLPAPSSTGYIISPDDTLDVAVFQIPDLNRTVQVDASGKVLLPLIGQVDAAGKTPHQLSERIADALSQKYLRNPQVTVSIKDSTSQKVTIDGAVLAPGIYPMSGPTSLLQAVAMAKGPDPKQANTRKVAIFRAQQDGSRVGTVYDLNAIRNGKAVDPPVQAKDIVVVAGSSGKNFLQNFSSAFPLVSLLRPW